MARVPAGVQEAGAPSVAELNVPRVADPGPLPEWAEGVRRVDGSFAAPVKIRHVNPIYPAAARESGAQGVVIIEARIDIDGRIRYARVIRSVLAFDEAALDAVRQWEFTPSSIDGIPAPVLLTVTLQFTLS